MDPSPFRRMTTADPGTRPPATTAAERRAARKRAERDELDLELLTALWHQSNAGAEWVEASTIASIVNRQRGLVGEDRLTGVGVGQHLARLVREGRCERRSAGFMGTYRLAERPS